MQAAMMAREVNNAQKKQIKKQSEESLPADSSADSKDKPSSSEVPSSGEENAAAMAKNEMDKKAEEEVIQKKIEKLSGHMFAVMWHMTAMDIRSTLYHVCRKVTHDHGVDEATRTKRCKALKILGQEFVKRGGSLEAGLGDIKAKMSSQISTAASAHDASSSGDKKSSSDNQSSTAKESTSKSSSDLD
mmetsp:Transcript_14246/g.19420  ORF Transcript_14246/g.19420 Transcript_14246/m.19420 type:complete len:188 (-) Transcript_14246:1003-1566(-)